VDPALLATAERALMDTPGVRGVHMVRLRWLGHSLHAEADILIDSEMTAGQAHELAHDAETHLISHLPRIVDATIHASPG